MQIRLGAQLSGKSLFSMHRAVKPSLRKEGMSRKAGKELGALNPCLTAF